MQMANRRRHEFDKPTVVSAIPSDIRLHPDVSRRIAGAWISTPNASAGRGTLRLRLLDCCRYCASGWPEASALVKTNAPRNGFRTGSMWYLSVDDFCMSLTAATSWKSSGSTPVSLLSWYLMSSVESSRATWVLVSWHGKYQLQFYSKTLARNNWTAGLCFGGYDKQAVEKGTQHSPMHNR